MFPMSWNKAERENDISVEQKKVFNNNNNANDSELIHISRTAMTIAVDK